MVPELASRHHVDQLPGIIEQALSGASCTWEDVDAVAVTYGPGLASSLLVGLSAAKALALRLGKPLLGVNHLEAHLYSVFMGEGAPVVEDTLPMLTLLVTGGHTCLVLVRGIGDYELLGQTLDDAAGEALDKRQAPRPGVSRRARRREGGARGIAGCRSVPARHAWLGFR